MLLQRQKLKLEHFMHKYFRISVHFRLLSKLECETMNGLLKSLY